MSWRGWAWTVLLALAACSSHTGVNDGCLGSGHAVLVVEIPVGMGSVPALQTTGDCQVKPGGCAPLCGAGCSCEFTIDVVDNRSPSVVCHIQVTSSTGQVFTQDLSFVAENGGQCPLLFPMQTSVTVNFADAAVPDAAGD
jgi:hypothetical protein